MFRKCKTPPPQMKLKNSGRGRAKFVSVEFYEGEVGDIKKPRKKSNSIAHGQSAIQNVPSNPIQIAPVVTKESESQKEVGDDLTFSLQPEIAPARTKQGREKAFNSGYKTISLEELRSSIGRTRKQRRRFYNKYQ